MAIVKRYELDGLGEHASLGRGASARHTLPVPLGSGSECGLLRSWWAALPKMFRVWAKQQ